MRILAVDDDPIIQDLLREALALHGHLNLVCANSAEEAQVMLEDTNDPFECFLLDVELPGANGIELCREIRGIDMYRQAPIIMITGSRAPDHMDRAFDAGATDYVTKPFDGLELGTRINLASMLNDSIARERQSLNRLEELAKSAQLGFEDRVVLNNVYGLSDILAVENQLLRSQNGCYAMTLYAVRILAGRAHFNAVSAAQFRQDLECIGAAIADCVNMASTQIAYAGRGIFVVIQHGRRRVDISGLGDDIRMRLNETWRPVSAATRTAPNLRAEEISNNRLWSGMAASVALDEYLSKTDTPPVASRPDEPKLFTSLRRRQGGNG